MASLIIVGAAVFETATSSAPPRRPTKLGHAPLLLVLPGRAGAI